jgi:glycosyltransferase involved in cell wall biosynthesis
VEKEKEEMVLSPAKIRYSIIIGALNHFDDCTKPCLEALVNYTDFSNDDTEIVLVANGCTDNTEERATALLRSLGLADRHFSVLSFPEPLGYARANNEGIKATSGEFVILLNNDAFLLKQKKNEWIELLRQPFDDPWLGCGLSGPLKGFSEPANHDFLVFFCVMIKRDVFTRTGLLDESYGVGAGEDTALCIDAERFGYKVVQVPLAQDTSWSSEKGIVVGGFPIYHLGEATVKDNPQWNQIFEQNAQKLREKYNEQWKLGNNYERAVIMKKDNMDHFPRERTRYLWAKEQMGKEKHVLELGCSNAYGLNILGEGIDYTGYDYCEAVMEFGRKEHPDAKFKVVNLEKEKIVGFWDTIIAFEVLEHLENCKELAQELKEHCNTLLCSVPYNEPKGYWGGWHKHHQLKEEDFPGFDYVYISMEGTLLDAPDETFRIWVDGVHKSECLMLMKWERKDKVKNTKEFEKRQVSVKGKHKILCTVSTKDRYFTTLPLAIQSIALQTRKPDHLIIFDDGEQRDLRTDLLYRYLFCILDDVGINWEFIFSERKGQHFNHQRAQEIAKEQGFDLIWRIDDDEVAAPDVLAKLEEFFISNPNFTPEHIGAVGGTVVNFPVQHYTEQTDAAFTLEDIAVKPNIQWYKGSNVFEVEHLYSTFLYRAGIVDYDLALSPAAHREETLFTHSLHRAGYKLLVRQDAVTYHLRWDTGGIRTNTNDAWVRDEEHFKSVIKGWNKSVKEEVNFVLDEGLGDHLVFANFMEDIQRQHKGKNINLYCVYKDVFAYDVQNQRLDTPIFIKSIENAYQRFGPDLGMFNVYNFMGKNGWNKHIAYAYKKLYNIASSKTIGMDVLSSRSLAQRRLSGRKTIIISPYSKKMRNGKENPKNYPWFGELVRALAITGFPIKQAGIANEKPLVAENHLLFDKSLEELGRIIADECLFWISVDNFFPHLAHHTGVPGIVLWGPSDPRIFGYQGNLNLQRYALQGDARYIRKNQFEPWEACEFKTERFLLPEKVMDEINALI